jgi:hypothetical protein
VFGLATSPFSSSSSEPPSLPSLTSSTSSSPQDETRASQLRFDGTSAADPWGNHLNLNMNPTRTMSCKLAIVRVNLTPTIQLAEQPLSP